MKKQILLGLFSAFTFCLFAQESDSTQKSDDKTGYKISENEEVEITTDEIEKKAKPDSTVFRVGETEIEIIEEDGETSIKFKDLKKFEEDELDQEEDNEAFSEIPEVPEIPEIPEIPGIEDNNDDGDDDDDNSKFKGHWAGFSFGPNNYIDKDFSLNRTPESEFLDLNTSKSWNFNLNFAQYSFPLIKDRFGLITGMGIEWSNYHFENSNSIKKDNGKVVADTLSVDLIKNRFQTTFLTVPLLFELQLFNGDRNDRLYISGGVIGGIKLFSNTKIKYYENGSKQKSKNKGDYYLNPLRYGLTARVGYKMVELYANYYLTPLFIENRGPELYPLAAGLNLSF
jgi:hypothetical protein